MKRNTVVQIIFGAGSAIAALAALALCLTNPAFAQKTMENNVIIALAAGIVTTVLCIVLKYQWLPLLPPICWGAALGLTIYHGAPVIMDKINGLNFLDGDPDMVITYLVLMALAALLSVVTSFVKGETASAREGV